MAGRWKTGWKVVRMSNHAETFLSFNETPAATRYIRGHITPRPANYTVETPEIFGPLGVFTTYHDAVDFAKDYEYKSLSKKNPLLIIPVVYKQSPDRCFWRYTFDGELRTTSHVSEYPTGTDFADEVIPA